MRLFSGMRDTNKKKSGMSASQMYKDRLAAAKGDKAPPSADEIYKKVIEERMAKMMEDYMLGKKKSAVALPGVKQDDDKPKEISKGTMLVIRMMAMKREARERKMEKKRDMKFLREKKAKLYQEKQQKLQEELLIKQKEDAYLVEQTAKNNSSSHFWGTEPENKGWW